MGAALKRPKKKKSRNGYRSYSKEPCVITRMQERWGGWRGRNELGLLPNQKGAVFIHSVNMYPVLICAGLHTGLREVDDVVLAHQEFKVQGGDILLDG